MAIQRHSLMLEVKVSKLLPSPQQASIGIGLFRVPTPYVEGHSVSDQTLTMLNGTSQSFTRPCSVLVLRTNQPLTVTYVSSGETNAIKVSSLLVLDQPVDQVTLTYDDADALADAYAQVSLIQA